jgi:YVTN family beta-propeller protein
MSRFGLAASIATAVMCMAATIPEVAQATAGNKAIGTVTHYQDADRPGRIAVTPDGTKAYVINALSNSVTVVDTLRGEAVKSIALPMGGTPANLAVSPDGSKVYVLNLRSHSISVISTQTDELAQKGTVSKYTGVNPYGIAFNPNPQVHHAYVTNNDPEASVSVIDTKDDAQIGLVTGYAKDKGAHGVAFSPDGKTAYVATNDSVVMIDTATDAETGSISNYHADVPLNIAVTKDGKKAYITNQGDDSVSVIDTQTNQETGKIADFTGHAPAVVSISPDDSTAYVTGYNSDDVSVIDVQQDKQIAKVANFNGKGPNGVAFFRQNTDQNTTKDIAYVASSNSNDVSIIQAPAAAKIARISPSTGQVEGGDQVVITGSNLTDTTKVLFGGVEADVTFVSDTELHVVTPDKSDHRPGTVGVVVENEGGNDNTGKFTYVTARAMPDQ